MQLSQRLLFSEKRLCDLFQGQLQSIQNEVDNVSREKFIANSDDQIVAYIFSKMEIVSLEIYKEQVERTEPKETKINKQSHFGETIRMPSVELDISLPFAGDPNLWKFQPSAYSFNPPRGEVKYSHLNDLKGNLVFRLGYYQNEFKSEKVNNEITSVLSSIESLINTQKSDLSRHNKKLINQIQQRVKSRRERIEAIFQEIETIEVPLKMRENVPDVTSLPINRRKIPILAEKPQSEHKYGISNKTYEEILALIRHQGATYERTPKTYHVHDEEELRDIMLGQLNGQFEGQATGETFRKKGKTDICIEVENRAAFVAECKVWHGEQQVLGALDQLFNYLTWRDVKTALIVFNKDVAGFKGIQEKLPQTLKTHSNFISVESIDDSTEWRMRLRSVDDNERYIEVHVFVFNLYVKQ